MKSLSLPAWVWGLLPLCDAACQLSLPDSPLACSITITRKNKGNYFGATPKLPLMLSATCPCFSLSVFFFFILTKNCGLFYFPLQGLLQLQQEKLSLPFA